LTAPDAHISKTAHGDFAQCSTGFNSRFQKTEESGRTMRIAKGLVVAVAAILSVSPEIWSQQTTSEPATVTTRWDDVTAVSATVATTQILAHAYTLRSSPIHDALFKALEDLHTNDTRLQSWYSVTRQAVLEIKEPTAGRRLLCPYLWQAPFEFNHYPAVDVQSACKGSS
jgi:hypothetical protein